MLEHFQPQRPGVSATARYLPAVAADGFVKGDQESLAASLHRITGEQFELAIGELCAPDMQIDLAIPRAVDALQRVRSVLRLVRSQIGDESFRTENAILKETQAHLARFHNGRPPLLAIDQLRSFYDAQLAPNALDNLRVRVVQRYQIQRLTAVSETGDGSDIVQTIRRARARFAAWPLEDDDVRVFGRDPVGHQFASISPGLDSTYRRGRRRLQKCLDHPTADRFSSWSSETRVLSHQMEILTSLWPEVLGGTARGLHQLTAVLSEEFAMAELLRAIHQQPHLCPEGPERSLVVALAQHQRAELQHVATTLGRRIYTESPDQFLDRIGAYWGTEQPEFQLDPPR